MTTKHALLLVAGNGCDAVDAVYPSYNEAVAALRAVSQEIGSDTWFSEPVDGQGIVYTITMCARTGKPELWTEYRYAITEEAEEADDE